MNIYTQRITKLRQSMRENKMDAYIVLTSDPHLSEYLPEYWKSREWLSGFSGSAGSLVVTEESAFLWSDGRYWIQAQSELQGSCIALAKLTATNTYAQWLLENLPPHSVVGVDSRVLPYALQQDLESKLAKREILLCAQDLISPLWRDRPLLPHENIFEHTLEYATQSRVEKLQKIRQKMAESQASYHLISSLDDIAWITNLRGSDIPYNPVFLAHLWISHEEAILFVEEQKISQSLKHTLRAEGFWVMPYEHIETFLGGVQPDSVLIDPSKITAHFVHLLQAHEIIQETNPSVLLKACKSDSVLAHMREAMEGDGVALCHFFAWLEDSLASGKKVSELDIDTQLSYFRSQNPLYVSDSFATIAGFNGNGAQPHYRATQESFSVILGDGLLLIDSGAQYKNGTTDITRVVPIGNITPAQKRDYTLVLKAHIAMASAIFPEGIAMPLLDSITRAPLWREQIDYHHGTGHGVGYFLNVHEGPQVLSCYAIVADKTKARVGMVSSIEPGIYRANQWGVRLENLVVNRLVDKPKEQFYGDFLCFEVLTLCPFENTCIDVELFSQEEKRWLNDYHQQVFDRLSPKLTGRALKWLTEKTSPLI